jgi:hypothetical protein
VLDRDRPAERAVERVVDAAHASAPELPADLEPPDISVEC